MQLMNIIQVTDTHLMPRGTELNCRSWLTEAPYRMIMNNLDPEVAENPDELIVYGGLGKAARNWESLKPSLKV